jgi:hypothetical protein
MVPRIAIALALGSALAGCAANELFWTRCTLPNMFGTPFRDRQEVLAQIPVGTPIDKARVVMRAHRYREFNDEVQGDTERVRFHPFEPGRIESDPATSITLVCHRGHVAEIETVGTR